MRCMSSNCFRRLTSAHPTALRDTTTLAGTALMISGFARSFSNGDDRLHTHQHLIVSRLTLSESAPCPVICPSDWYLPPMFFICLSCSRGSRSGQKPSFFSLVASFSACARSALSISSIRTVRRPCREYAGDTIPSGTAPARQFFSRRHRGGSGLPVI